MITHGQRIVKYHQFLDRLIVIYQRPLAYYPLNARQGAPQKQGHQFPLETGGYTYGGFLRIAASD